MKMEVVFVLSPLSYAHWFFVCSHVQIQLLASCNLPADWDVKKYTQFDSFLLWFGFLVIKLKTAELTNDHNCEEYNII